VQTKKSQKWKHKNEGLGGRRPQGTPLEGVVSKGVSGQRQWKHSGWLLGGAHVKGERSKVEMVDAPICGRRIESASRHAGLGLKRLKGTGHVVGGRGLRVPLVSSTPNKKEKRKRKKEKH